MSMIIRTRRSRTAVIADTLLTALGWLGFSYLVMAGVIAVVSGVDHSLEISMLGSVLPTTQVLLLYAVIAAINALLLMLWGTYRRRLTRVAPRDATILDDALFAERFALSRPQLQDIRLSQLLVIHHTENGEISRWESADTSAIRLSA